MPARMAASTSSCAARTSTGPTSPTKSPWSGVMVSAMVVTTPRRPPGRARSVRLRPGVRLAPHLVLPIAALAAVHPHVDGPEHLGFELEQQPVLGLHVGVEGLGRLRARGRPDVLVDEGPTDRPDVEVRQLAWAGHSIALDVARQCAHGLDAQRSARIGEELLAPDTFVGAREPELAVAPQEPDRHGVRAAVTPEAGQHGDVRLGEADLEVVGLHPGHDAMMPRSAALRSVSLTLGQSHPAAGPGATGALLMPRSAALRSVSLTLGLADARSIAPGRGPGRH